MAGGDPGKVGNVASASLQDLRSVEHNPVSVLVFPGAGKFYSEIGQLAPDIMNNDIEEAD